MDGSRTRSILLATPLQQGDRTWNSLELREPRVSEVKAAADRIGSTPTKVAMLEAQIDLVARVSGLPAALIEDLPAQVLEEAAAFVSSFEEAARRPAEDEPDLAAMLFIELDAPVETERSTETSMNLRPPTVRERKRAEAHLSRGYTLSALLNHEITLVESVSGWQHVNVLKMPIGPFAQAADYLTGFFQAGRATGNSSRPT